MCVCVCVCVCERERERASVSTKLHCIILNLTCTCRAIHKHTVWRIIDRRLSSCCLPSAARHVSSYFVIVCWKRLNNLHFERRRKKVIHVGLLKKRKEKRSFGCLHSRFNAGCTTHTHTHTHTLHTHTRHTRTRTTHTHTHTPQLSRWKADKFHLSSNTPEYVSLYNRLTVGK